MAALLGNPHRVLLGYIKRLHLHGLAYRYKAELLA